MLARYQQTQRLDEPLAMLRDGTTSYYHADGLGSVTSLSNAAGALAQTYTVHLVSMESTFSQFPEGLEWVCTPVGQIAAGRTLQQKDAFAPTTNV